MTTTADYPSAAEARKHFKVLLDAAATGLPSHLHRDAQHLAVVDAELLVRHLAGILPRVEVVPEDGGWSVFIPGMPIAADGATFAEATDQMVQALREYADDWVARLHRAPNHADNWALVQVVSLSDDEHLARWVSGSAK